MSNGAIGGQGGVLQPVKDGIGCNNPVLCQALGICSALAVTGYVKPTVVMGAALLFVASFSSLAVSLLRNVTPHRVRLIVEMLVIATLVGLVYQFLRAYWFTMSEALGAYVALIITNCLILGRCEGFAMRNGPIRSALDGFGSAAGYALVLLAIAAIREPLGHGTLLGYPILPGSYVGAQLISGPPGAFLAMGIIVWIVRAIWPEEPLTEHPEAQ